MVFKLKTILNKQTSRVLVSDYKYKKYKTLFVPVANIYTTIIYFLKH